MVHGGLGQPFGRAPSLAHRLSTQPHFRLNLQTQDAAPSQAAHSQRCPVCGRPHPAPLGGHVRRLNVLSWKERKSSRGKRGADSIQGLKCQACGKRLRQTLFQSARHCPVTSPHSRRPGRPSPLGRQLGLDPRQYRPTLPTFRGVHSPLALTRRPTRRKGSRPLLPEPDPRPSSIGRAIHRLAPQGARPLGVDRL